MSPRDKLSRKPARVPSILATSPHPGGSGPTEPRTPPAPEPCRGGGASRHSAGLVMKRRKKPAGCRTWPRSWEVETRGGGTRRVSRTLGASPRKDKRLFPPHSLLQPGRYPHTHTEPLRALVHPGVKPKFFPPDRLGSKVSARVGDSCAHG